ncbi:TIGR03752 family integrating conjugative element protein [Conservatibacter flavescens]|uniref:TIGR03752 family integrating conjugative element protein n=1 Tax=Conservatibacter flavescens TaxID=28161 RepID=A0A2M8S0Y5_9PAST|nr:TIGR03752 family integrating conjugative element protein [Conservatibacter flavescens]PJG84809.1 TIGR03752 family integrating conjugative element protein [Conservatibacter flavescens]
MKANKMFLVISLIIILMIGGVSYLLFSNSAPSLPISNKNVLDTAIKDLTPEEIRQLGLEGDTKNDTVRTLIGAAKEGNRRYDRVISQNDKIIRENEELRKREQNVQQQVDEAVQAKTQELQDVVEMLKSEIAHLAQNQTTSNQAVSSQENISTNSTGNIQSNTPLPIGNTVPGSTSIIDDENAVEWISPDDQIQDEKNPAKIGFPNNHTPNGYTSGKRGLPFIEGSDDNATGTNTAQTRSLNSKQKKKIATYTIPENSTLMGSTSMTALLGRIPIGNSVNDPYPFKVIIGRDNLIANGIELPDIEQAIVSGTATGDWTLSCVRGNVKSLTFVFSDGRIVTSGKNNSETIGWLSDPHGIPCIPGERKTNAPEYLGTHFLLAAAGAAAQGYSQAQTTTVVDGNAVVGAVTGQQGKYVVGQALGQGIQETANWFKERYGQNFDAVYVPPGHAVAIHIDKAIEIDYDLDGRKVKYGRVSRSSQLD